MHHWPHPDHPPPPLSLRKQPPIPAWGPAKVSWPGSVRVERALCKHSHTHSHATAHNTRFSLCFSRRRPLQTTAAPLTATHTTLRTELCGQRTRSPSVARRKGTTAQPSRGRPFGLASYIICGNYILKSSTLSPSLGISSTNPAHSHSGSSTCRRRSTCTRTHTQHEDIHHHTSKGTQSGSHG